MEVDEAGPSNSHDGQTSGGKKGRGAGKGGQGSGGGGKGKDRDKSSKGNSNNKRNRKAGGRDNEDSQPVLSLVEQLATRPYDSALHKQHIAEAATPEEREEARAFMSQMVRMDEQSRLDWIAEKKESELGKSMEGRVEVLELYKRACADGLSIKLHRDYADYVISIYFEARGYTYPDVLQDEEAQPDADVASAREGEAGIFDEEFVEGELMAAVGQTVRCHLSEGQTVWRLLHDFELFRLRASSDETALERMETIYLSRLIEPHLQLAETHQLFSSFISKFKNQDYEQLMVASQPLYNETSKTVSARERKEDQLKSKGFTEEAYGAYLDWEQEVKTPDAVLVETLYERALAHHPTSPLLWKGALEHAAKAVRQPKNLSNLPDEGYPLEKLAEWHQRAVRALPFSGEVIALCIRQAEAIFPEEIAAAFSEAQQQRCLEATPQAITLEDFIAIIIACADYARHAGQGEADEEQEAGPSEALSSLLQNSISKVKTLSAGAGDPHLRLEKYLARQYERANDTDAIDGLFASLSQSYPTSAMVLVARADYLQRYNNIEGARKLFQSVSKKRYDYPEYVFSAWANFEHQDGTLATLEKALDAISHEMKFVQARREKEARLQQAAAYAAAEQAQPAESTPTAAVEVSEQAPQAATEAWSSKKRPASELSPQGAATELPEANKRAKQETPDVGELKRDRENATVAVTGLHADATEDAVKRLFRDCGAVREIKLRVLEDQAVATIEFMNRDQVPAALTKDKKRIEDQEVGVSPVWQSTLYVTNFPESFDAADVQALFQPIFETRWPSRRLKNTRRFVYIQYINPAAAQKALELHNTEVVPGSGQRIQVFISDPQRKQTRTDANAGKREIYVTGLHRQATEADLEKLFATFGTLKGSRVLKDDDGKCKGAGFVDFETEEAANAALSMNNTEYRKKRLAVVLADSRVSHKTKPVASGQGRRTDLRNRSLRVVGLPKDSEEPLVQQFFEHHGKTTSVEIKGNTAVVTFADPADAGKLLLAGDTLEYEGQTLHIKEHVEKAPVAQRDGLAENGDSRPSVAGFMPRAGRGRGKKLGIGASGGRSGARPPHNAAEAADAAATDTTAPVAAPAPANGANGTDAPAQTASAGPAKSQADFKALLMGKK